MPISGASRITFCKFVFSAMVGDGMTQPGNEPPSSVAQPPLDDAGARGGKLLKNQKIQVRQMQPMSRMVLFKAAHYEACSGSLPHDLINIAVDDVLKRVSKARALEDPIRELQGLCPGMPVDRMRLIIATYEPWIGDKLKADVCSKWGHWTRDWRSGS